MRRRTAIELPYCERPDCRNRVKPPRGTRLPEQVLLPGLRHEGRSEQMAGTPRRAGTQAAIAGLKGAAARWSAKREDTKVIERPSESRQAPPPRPITAIYNPAVVVRPARPAPRRARPRWRAANVRRRSPGDRRSRLARHPEAPRARLGPQRIDRLPRNAPPVSVVDWRAIDLPHGRPVAPEYPHFSAALPF